MKSKLLISCLICFLFCCESRIEDNEIVDYGKKQIGENLYIQKLKMSSGDRIYLLVDQNGRLISTNTTTSYTVTTGKSSHYESNVLIK
jgi:hypothetical protein